MTCVLPGGLGQIKASGLPFSAWSTINSGANASGGPPPSYWGPPNGNPAPTFSNQNRTIICPVASQFSSVSSSSLKTSGKLYCEVTMNGVGTSVAGGSGNISIGIVTGDNLQSSYVGYMSASAGFLPGVSYYSLYNSGSAVGWHTSAAPTNGDTLMVAVDLTGPPTVSINLGINGLWLAQGGNSSTMPAYFDAQLSATIFGACVACTEDNSGTMVINAGSSAFKYTVPTGYAAWK